MGLLIILLFCKLLVWQWNSIEWLSILWWSFVCFGDHVAQLKLLWNVLVGNLGFLMGCGCWNCFNYAEIGNNILDSNEVNRLVGGPFVGITVNLIPSWKQRRKPNCIPCFNSQSFTFCSLNIQLCNWILPVFEVVLHFHTLPWTIAYQSSNAGAPVGIEEINSLNLGSIDKWRRLNSVNVMTEWVAIKLTGEGKNRIFISEPNKRISKKRVMFQE